MFAHRMIAGSRFFMGDFAGAHQHYEKAMPLLDSSKRAKLTLQLGVDPAIQLLCYFAWLRCIEGHTEEARRLDARAHEIGASLPHVHARAQMHMLCGFRAAFERDDTAMAADAQALARLAAEHGLSMYKHYADLLLGWPDIRASSGVHGRLVAFSRTLERLLAGGARFLVPFCQAQLAMALAASGRDREARFAIERALDECEETAQGWCDAELWRVHGEICWYDGHGDAAEAVQCFERSLELARGRGARLWELRAAVSLARLWQVQGEADKALGLLAPVFEGFSEGFDGRDPVEAQALLDELREVPPKSGAPSIQGVP